MAQLQHIDARLDTLFTEMYQVNIHVGRIARRQATIGVFSLKATPSPPSVNSNSDDEDGDDDDAFEEDDDGDTSSTNEMST